MDVFSFSNDLPYRIEFFGDDVDSIRTFDVETQLSTEKVKRITIIPNVENKFLDETRESFLKYIAPNTLVFVKNLDLLFDRLDSFFEKAITSFDKLSSDIKHARPQELFVNSDLLKKQLPDFKLLTLSGTLYGKEKELDPDIVFRTKPQPSFNKKFDLLIDNLNENRKKGYTNYIFCASDQQAKRFHDIFDEVDQEVAYRTLVFPIFQGFIDDDLKLACYSEPPDF